MVFVIYGVFNDTECFEIDKRETEDLLRFKYCKSAFLAKNRKDLNIKLI